MKEKKADQRSNHRSAKTTRVGPDFAPTLGELDLHLFGEGKHEEVPPQGTKPAATTPEGAAV